jgi:HEAT repeat protein
MKKYDKKLNKEITKLLTGKKWPYDEWNVRCKAARALGKIGDTRAVPALAHAYYLKPGDSIQDKLIGECVSRAIETIINKNSVSNIVKAIINSNFIITSNFASEIAEKMLNKNIDPSEVLVLINALEDGNDYVKVIATRLLVNCGNFHAVPGLIKLLKDGDARVRHNVAQALGEIGDSRAVPALITALNDEYSLINHNMYIEVLSALKKIGDQSAVPSLIKTLENGDARINKDARIRSNIFGVLSNLGDTRNVHELINVFENSEYDEKNYVLLALGQFKDQKAVNTLLNALGDEKLRFCAIRALGNIGDPSTLEAIEYFMKNDPDEYVRKEAFEAALKIRSLFGNYTN